MISTSPRYPKPNQSAASLSGKRCFCGDAIAVALVLVLVIGPLTHSPIPGGCRRRAQRATDVVGSGHLLHVDPLSRGPGVGPPAVVKRARG